MESSNNINRYPDSQFFGRVLLMNAPMGTGKDYAAERIALALNCDQLEFKAPMFNIAMAMTNLGKEEFFDIYNDRERKETPQKEFYGLSPRNFMIWISEGVCKPKFGKEFFGNISADSINPDVGAVFSDSGFPDEVGPLARKFGAENIYICQFDRGGSRFKSNDSRSFLHPDLVPAGVKFLPFMHNDGCIQKFVNEVTSYVMTY